MTIPQVTLGIDVSGEWLDAFDHPGGRSRRFHNDKAGIAALIDWARRLCAFVVLEATAPFDQRLIRALETAGGLTFHRANPGRARDFARSIGLLAKTDRIDARMLAAYGAAVPLRPTAPRAPQRLALQGLCARRDQLVAMRKAERTRLKAAPDPLVADSLKAVIDILDDQIRQFDRRIEETAQSPELGREHAVLRAQPGIGPVASGILLATLPELGRVDRRAIAALAGLAPVARDSGRMYGKRHVRGGRKRVRDALYMAALSAVRTPPWKPLYAAMRAAGKPPKLALIAIARRLLVTLNAHLRNQIGVQA